MWCNVIRCNVIVFYSVSDCLNCGIVAHLPSVLRQHSLPCLGGGVQPGPASCLLSAVRPGLSVFCLLHNIQSVHIDPPRPSVRATDTTRKLSSSRDFVDNTLSDTPVATLVTIWRLSVGVGSSEYWDPQTQWHSHLTPSWWSPSSGTFAEPAPLWMWTRSEVRIHDIKHLSQLNCQ